MRVNVTKVNLKKLSHKIFEYQRVKGEYPEYIVMSQDTMDALYEYPNTYNKSVSPTMYQIPIAVNSAVPFGEVDLV